MVGDWGTGEVIGRWELGPGRPLHRQARIHPARLIGTGEIDERLIELHPAPSAGDLDIVLAQLRQAVRLSDPALLTLLDVGVAERAGSTIVYVTTAAWQELLEPGPRTETELIELARVVSRGLGSLHRAQLVHGAIHREAIRRRDGQWRLGPAGIAPLIETDLAPYRPPGLHVVEPLSPAADLWSLGVVLHEQAVGRLLRPGEPPRVPGMARIEGLVGELLRPEPADRPTADQVGALLDTTRPVAPYPSSVGGGPANVDPGPPPAGLSPAAAARPAAAAGAEQPGPEDPSALRRLAMPVALALVAVAAVAIAGLLLLPGDGDDDQTTEISTEEAGADGPVDSTTSSIAAPADGSDDPSPAGEAPADDEETATGPVPLAELERGDCVEVDLSIGNVAAAERVPCDQPHMGQIIGLVPSDDDTYPGRAALIDDGNTRCEEHFATFVGETSFLTSISVTPLAPTFGEWDRQERRTTVCLAYPFDRAPLTGSIEGRANAFLLLEGADVPMSKLFPGQCFRAEPAIDGVGRRQTVTLLSCFNLHRNEVIAVRPVPLDGDGPVPDVLAPEVALDLIDTTRPLCQDEWDSLQVPDTLPEPTIKVLVSDTLDWQLGDRLLSCIAAWDEPLVGSAILMNAEVQREAADEDGGE